MVLVLFIIYLAFICFGIPGAYIGAAWPEISSQFGFNISYAGFISMLIAFGVVLANLSADRMLRRIGSGRFVIVGCIVAGLGLLGFSFSTTLPLLSVCALIYGYGSGCADVTINNYVALHYSAKHMNWLHFCWGAGDTIGAYLIGATIGGQLGWTGGYRIAVGILAVLAVIVLLSLPKWRKSSTERVKEEAKDAGKALSIRQVLKISGVPYAFLTMFAYCAIEQSTALWASSYLVYEHGINTATAAKFAGFFWSGLTIGRLACGFIADRFGDKKMIWTGVVTIGIGTVLLALPLPVHNIALFGLVLAGLGCAPVYPCVMHATPENFGEENCQAVLSLQSACANSGSIFIPFILGLFADWLGIGIFPFVLIIFVVLIIFMSERMHKVINRAKLAREI